MSRAALVLAGGRSTRMGRDKATLELCGVPLLHRVLCALEGVVDERVVAARRGQALPALAPGVTRVDDEVEDLGPLGGLAPGLGGIRAPVALVVACDAPLLEPALVERLFRSLGAADVAVAQAGGRLHPLLAVYRRALAPLVADLLAQGLRRPVDLYERVHTVVVPEAELRQADPALASLHNLNTPADLVRAEDLLGPRVRVELYEGARGLAGQAEVEVRGGTLGRALAELALRAPGLAGRVVAGGRPTPHWRVSLGGRRWIDDPATPLAEGDVLVVVSALAGG